jgi:hypothetical protein
MKSTFFTGSGSPEEKESAEKNITGFVKKDKVLLAELKANFNALVDSFQNESASIIAESQKKATPKQQVAQANAKLSRWHDSPLQLLITKAGYSVGGDEASEFSNSGEYPRLKKMFLEADLDFSGETAETQAALQKFVITFREFEAWLQNREELMRAGSMEPLLAEAANDHAAISNYDRYVEKFKNNCDRLAEMLQDNIKTLFMVLGARSQSGEQTLLKLQQAHTKLQEDDITQEQHADLLKTIAALNIEKSHDQARKFTSQFFRLYCEYKNASLSSSPSELVKTDLYENMRLLIQGSTETPAANFSNEKLEVQKLIVALRNSINAFENMRRDRFFFEAYPELRENAYQSPKHL